MGVLRLSLGFLTESLRRIFKRSLRNGLTGVIKPNLR
jgi:hypothetical protein